MNGHPALLRPAERLARSAPSEISDARRSVDEVLRRAAELARLLPAGPDEPDPVWQLARRLASLRVPPSFGRPVAAVEAADVAFRSAIVGSLEAIRMCRQTLHVSGACWFATGEVTDGCGEVLRAAHALS
ncbi:MAG: hypothetical protein KY461_12230 [Actinobacteria bacterium]|nr:hypothetical protein [Actinomycetota bacterium]